MTNVMRRCYVQHGSQREPRTKTQIHRVYFPRTIAMMQFNLDVEVDNPSIDKKNCRKEDMAQLLSRLIEEPNRKLENKTALRVCRKASSVLNARIRGRNNGET